MTTLPVWNSPCHSVAVLRLGRQCVPLQAGVDGLFLPNNKISLPQESSEPLDGHLSPVRVVVSANPSVWHSEHPRPLVGG